VSIANVRPAASHLETAAAYLLELVDRELQQGFGAIVTVRQVHRPTGTLVPQAVAFISRMDMSPDGMDDMAAPLELLAGGFLPLRDGSRHGEQLVAGAHGEGAWRRGLSPLPACRDGGVVTMPLPSLPEFTRLPS
jgi:hypothetical protein